MNRPTKIPFEESPLERLPEKVEPEIRYKLPRFEEAPYLDREAIIERGDSHI